MKYVEPFDIGGFCASPPAREVWIEMGTAGCRSDGAALSPPAREVWIEISTKMIAKRCSESHLPRGRCGLKFNAIYMQFGVSIGVASREGGVD